MAVHGKNYTWRGAEFKRKLGRHIDKNLDMAAIFLTNDIKQSFGNSGVTGQRSGATRAQRAANRSQPWGPPNVDTGHLKRNTGWDRPSGRPGVRRIGTGIGNKQSVGYAMWLEFGTRKMLPRPFLRPSIPRNLRKLRAILTRKMR